MRRYGFHLFVRTFTAFSGVLATLVGIAWVTQALRRFDLITAKGQAIVLYLGLTMLVLPQVISIVAPFALVVALAIVLSQMHASSNLVAITAAGVSQRQLARPFLGVAMVVSLIVGAIGFWAGPKSASAVSAIGDSVRADVVANVIQPGRFTEVDEALTIHIRDRAGDGTLLDLFISDQRDQLFTYTYSAERGRIADVAGRSMIVMENGTVERTRRVDRSTTFVAFGSYAFDLSQLTPTAQAGRHPLNELTFDALLANRSKSDSDYSAAEIAGEIQNRLADLVYPLAMTFAVFLFLGYPTANRRGQAPAVALALLTGAITRLLGFAVLGLSKANVSYASVAVLIPVGLTVVFATLVFTGVRPALPRSFGDWLDAIGHRVARRFGGGDDASGNGEATA
jgi:lipopolysaccharide export system permease protein